MKLSSFVEKLNNQFQDTMVLFLPLQRIQLLSIGVWPLGAQAIHWYIFLGFFNSIFNGVTTLAEFAFSYYHRDNLEDILASLSPALTKMNIAFKIFVMVWKRDQFLSLLNALEKYYENYMNPREIRISRKLSKRSFVICLILSVFSQMTGIFFAILPIFRNVYQTVSNETRVSELPFKSEWPWNWEASPLYEFTYLLQVYGSWLTSSAVAGIDCVFMGIFLHASAEFRCISSQIQEFGCEIDRKAPDLNVLTKEENKHSEELIKKIVKRHCNCIELCDKLSEFGKEIILGHFVTSSITVCMTSVNLLIAEWSQKPVYVTYILTVLTQAFVYCYGGELMSESVNGYLKCLKFHLQKLILQSVQINKDLYLISWHKLDGRRREALKLMIQRAQRPSEISVPFFRVSLPTFGNVSNTISNFIFSISVKRRKRFFL